MGGTSHKHTRMDYGITIQKLEAEDHRKIGTRNRERMGKNR